MVTKNAEKLRADILEGKPSPITYNSAKPEEILEEDKLIAEYPIPATPEPITITPVSQVFQARPATATPVPTPAPANP